MRVKLNTSFSQSESFIKDELPKLIYQTAIDSKLGGKFVRNTFKLDKLKNQKIIINNEDEYKTSVFLGKASNKISLGFRRILLHGFEQNNKSIIQLSETKNTVLIFISVIVGLFIFILPGLLIMWGNSNYSRHNRIVIQKVIDEIHARFPDSIIEQR